MKLSEIFTYQFIPGKLFNIPEHPLNAFLDLTTQCNNKCLFCYNTESQVKSNVIVNPSKLKSIVTLLGSTGTKEILYLGGEPFSYPFILEILNTGKKYEMFQRAVTNGSYLKDNKFCKELKEAGLTEVGISFHSSKKEVHDKLAGREGAYDDAIEGIDRCLEAGIPVFIQYSPNQLNSLDDILHFAQLIRRQYGNSINMFDVNRLLPVGMGRNAGHIILNKQQWFKFLVTLTRVLDLNFEVRVELTPFCWIKEMADRYEISEAIIEKIFSVNRGCYMWIAQLPLDFNGNIKFCPAGEKVGPNILEVDWPKYWMSGDLFQKFRNFSWNDICIDFSKNKPCEFFYKCIGGCKSSSKSGYQIDILSIESKKNYEILNRI
jgi:MoaA/NifB/PqqE/SkfB family radical SAM enzyme